MSCAISISSSYLPVDQPVYALQAAGAEPGATPLRTMSDLAASYIAAIHKSVPHGAYNIGGWSFGGYVAIEMARQLADEEMAHLILLDTIALGDGPRPLVAESDLITSFFMELMLAWHETCRRRCQRSGPTSRIVTHCSIRSFATRVEAGIVPDGSSLQLIRRLYEIFRANSRQR